MVSGVCNSDYVMNITQATNLCIAEGGGTFEVLPGYIAQATFPRGYARPSDVSPESWNAKHADFRTYVPRMLGSGWINEPLPLVDDPVYCSLVDPGHTPGYYVSLAGHEHKAPELTPEVVRGYLLNHWVDCCHRFFGAWFNDGVWCLDVTTHWQDLRIAQADGYSNNQTHIWDIANSCAIEVLR